MINIENADVLISTSISFDRAASTDSTPGIVEMTDEQLDDISGAGCRIVEMMKRWFF